MRFLADMGISPKTVAFLREPRYETVHPHEEGLATQVFLLLGAVSLLVVLGEIWHFGLGWILFAAWTLLVVVVGRSTSDKRESWQTALAVLALIGFGGAGF